MREGTERKGLGTRTRKPGVPEDALLPFVDSERSRRTACSTMRKELSRLLEGARTEAPRDPGLVRRARQLLEEPAVRKAERILRERDERTLADQVELTEIEAPPFGEGPRAQRMAELLTEAGLDDVHRDREGNVLARRGGPERPLILSAHLDTVFPPGTDVRVRRKADRLEGPGISDDGRGLAALVALARTVVESELDPGPLLFVATVGEEGAGDLRGVRHLFREGGPGRRARGFVSVDGAGLSRLVTGGLGSRRYRIRACGPGGHSWVDFGTPNPIHALGRVVVGATELALPEEPATSLTVARWSGGRSVNAIPEEAWIELEIRSEASPTLEELDRSLRDLVQAAVAHVRGPATGTGRALEMTVEVIGDRPPGRSDPSSALVRSAIAATRSVGVTPELAVSSTDANIPMTLGIPALTLGGGGEAGDAHTSAEWYRNVRGPEGLLRILLTALLFDRLEAPGPPSSRSPEG